MPRPAKTRLIPAALLLAAASPTFAATCFSMFDAKNALVYQSSASPIDLSRSISVEMARRYPGRTLVISDLGACAATGAAADASSALGSASPMAASEGPPAYGSDTTSPAPIPRAPDAASPSRFFTRAPGGRR